MSAFMKSVMKLVEQRRKERRLRFKMLKKTTTSKFGSSKPIVHRTLKNPRRGLGKTIGRKPARSEMYISNRELIQEKAGLRLGKT